MENILLSLSHNEVKILTNILFCFHEAKWTKPTVIAGNGIFVYNRMEYFACLQTRTLPREFCSEKFEFQLILAR